MRQSVPVQIGCETSNAIATLVKNFDFDNDTSENLSAIWQMKDHKDRSSFEELPFGMPRCHAKMCTTKAELCNRRSFIRKLCTTL